MKRREQASASLRGSIDEDTFITVDREDVIDAVADYVKGRIKSHGLFDSAHAEGRSQRLSTLLSQTRFKAAGNGSGGGAGVPSPCPVCL